MARSDLSEHFREHTEVLWDWLHGDRVLIPEVAAEMGYWLRDFGFDSIPDYPAPLESEDSFHWTAGNRTQIEGM